jgi:hypothetical protein
MKDLLSLKDKQEESKSYLVILNAIQEIPFSVGRKLLIDFLIGNRKNKSVIRNNLDSFENFGIFSDRDKISKLIDSLVHNNLIEISSCKENPFFKLLKITAKGKKELSDPSFLNKKLKNNFTPYQTNITEEDRIKFRELDSFLSAYNDEQKKNLIP